MVRAVATHIAGIAWFAIIAIMISIQFEYGHLFPRQQTRMRIAFILLFLSVGLHWAFEALDWNGTLHAATDIGGAIAAVGAVCEFLSFRRQLRATLIKLRLGGE